MCGPSVASLAEQKYQQIKPEKLPLPSLAIDKKKDRKVQYAAYRTGQERRQTLLNIGNDYA